MPYICSTPFLPLTSLATITPQFVAGTTIIVLAGLLRRWCYVTLGRFFTFEVTIDRDHKLVTSGPYAYVRHPSYTAGLAMLIGTYLVHFGANEYMTVCHIMSSPAAYLVYLWGISVAYGYVATYRRTFAEDEVLRGRFGGVWDKYRQETPYRLIPYVF